jgi:hypothetical protein
MQWLPHTIQGALALFGAVLVAVGWVWAMVLAFINLEVGKGILFFLVPICVIYDLLRYPVRSRYLWIIFGCAAAFFGAAVLLDSIKS